MIFDTAEKNICIKNDKITGKILKVISENELTEDDVNEIKATLDDSLDDLVKNDVVYHTYKIAFDCKLPIVNIESERIKKIKKNINRESQGVTMSDESVGYYNSSQFAKEKIGGKSRRRTKNLTKYRKPRISRKRVRNSRKRFRR
jgi:hypothetical protein